MLKISLPWGLESFLLYEPAEESWCGSHLESRRVASGRIDRIPSLGTSCNKPGRIFASGVVLESTTEACVRKFGFFVLLHSRFCLSSLSSSGKLSATPCLDAFRD